MSAPNVKFPRQIYRGMRGEDVQGHKRAISRAAPDLYPWDTFTQLAGRELMDAVVKLKRRWGFKNRQEAIGKTFHERLERTHAENHPDEWAFDPKAIDLCHAYWQDQQETPESKVRAAIVAAGFFWYDHRWPIAYSQFRPFVLGKPPWVPHRWDCSGFATACHYAGGAPDPNGRGYDHLGYTGTLIEQGTRVSSVTDLSPGDLIFYGSSSGRPGFQAGSPTHVALYVGVRDDTHMVLSHGSYPMHLYRYNYRTPNHYRHYKVA